MITKTTEKFIMAKKKITSFDISLASEDDRLKLQDAIREWSGSKTRDEAEKDHKKDIYETLITSVEIPQKMFTDLAKMYHKQNKDEVSVKNDVLISTYEKVFKE